MSRRWPSSTFGRCLPFWIHSVCGSKRENTFSCAGMVSSCNSRRWTRSRCLSNMRVQSLAKETGPAAQRPERTGIFTTGLISQVADHTIALFVTGHRHAGENLNQLPARRAANSSPPIQRCDALSRTPSKEFQSLLANGLSHGRRQFVDMAQNFPQECQHVVENLGEVYPHEAQAKKAGFSPEARLRFHQERS